jgi:iron complex outermembrane receptor protein
MTIRQFLLLSSAFSAVSGLAGVAAAAPTAGAAATGDVSTVGEVVVTAEKREQSLQTVAASVSAFTSKQRDLIGLSSIQDLTNFTPGLSYNTNLDRIAIRGIGRNTNNLSSDPGVATYVDGIYNAQTFTASNDSLFLNRIEVLRGPEGTLYGRNAIGGTINAISRRPTDDFYAEVRADAGSYEAFKVEGAMSGPLAPGLKFRLGASYSDQEQGYFHNLSGGGPTEGGAGVGYYIEGQLQANVGDKFDAWVKFADSYFDLTYHSAATVGPQDLALDPFGTLSPGVTFGFTTPGFIAEPGTPTTNPANSNIRNFSTAFPDRISNTGNFQVDTQMTWHFADADLKYIGGIQHYLINIDSDFAGSGLLSYTLPVAPSNKCLPALICPPLQYSTVVPFNYIEDKTFYSNELNLTSTRPGPLQWIVGLYEYGEHYNQPVTITEPGNAALATPAFGAASNPQRIVYYIDQQMAATSYAGFAQVDWKFTDTLKFTGGLRYTEDHKEGVENTRQICFGLVACLFDPSLYGSTTKALDVTGSLVALPLTQTYPGTGPITINSTTGLASRDLSASWHAVTGTAGLEWTPSAQTMMYAKYSRGYKSGGFNSGTLIANPETAPETVNAYEVGYKGNFFHQLQIDAAAFYYDYSADQIPLTVQPPLAPAQTQFFNIPQVRTYGFELEGIWAATHALTFNLSYAYLNSTITSMQTSKGFECVVDGADPQATQPQANISGCPLAVPTKANPTPSQFQNVTNATVPQSPRNKVALNVLYRFEFEPGALTLSGSYIWKDSTYSSIFNRPYNLAPAYDQVDLRAVWTDAKDRYTVILFGKNVFNTLGYDGVSGNFVTSTVPSTLAKNDVPGVNKTISLTAPQTFGVEFQYRFR